MLMWAGTGSRAGALVWAGMHEEQEPCAAAQVGAEAA